MNASLVLSRTQSLIPGLMLAGTIGFAASYLSEHYGAPVMLFALLIGIAFNFLSNETACKEGIAFASKTLLRVAIVFLGARITLGDIVSLGFGTLLSVLGLLLLTVATGFVCAILFNRKWRFALLTGCSVAICGASAALAVAALIPPTDRTEKNLLFTVVAVTALSTVSMIAYPILFSALGYTPTEIGFLIGATVHDVAQVVGAGYSVSTEAGDVATIVKLMRISLLPVVLIALVFLLPRPEGEEGKSKIGLPFFVIGFIVVVSINSIGFVPSEVASFFGDVSKWMMILAISALGTKTSLKAMFELGGGHIAVVVIETLVLLIAATLLLEFGILSF
jgi:uncharacterized integral membrane protein (TIGR00698 family)